VRSSQGVSLASLHVRNLRPMAKAGEGHDVEIRSIVLDALIAGRPIDDIADVLRPYHGHGSTYPASVLLELAADAFLACGSSRTDPLEVGGLAERTLPEDPARGNVAHSKRRHCVQGAIMVAAGAEPEDTGWWSVDDLWQSALRRDRVRTRRSRTSGHDRRGRLQISGTRLTLPSAPCEDRSRTNPLCVKRSIWCRVGARRRSPGR